MKLPGAVEVCPLCEGKREYEQMYTAGCGRGYFRMNGDCDFCDATGYVYKGTGKAVHYTVVHQIKQAQGEQCDFRPLFRP